MSEIASSRPADFDAYWESVDRELAQYPGAPTLERLALPSDEFSTVYALRLTSIGPYRIESSRVGDRLSRVGTPAARTAPARR